MLGRAVDLKKTIICFLYCVGSYLKVNYTLEAN